MPLGELSFSQTDRKIKPGLARQIARVIVDLRRRSIGFVTFTGYAINMLAVPALAIAGQWSLAGAATAFEMT